MIGVMGWVNAVGLLSLTFAAVACGSAPSVDGTSADGTRTVTSVIDLSRVPIPPSGSSSVPVSLGDRVDVTIDLLQADDQYRACAEPTVKDSFGNALAVLSSTDAPGDPAANVSRRETSGSRPLSLTVRYRFAFFAAASGPYSVSLDNHECSVAILPSSATVTWRIEDR